EEGYVRAASLASTHTLRLCVVRENVSTVSQQEAILFQGVRASQQNQGQEPADNSTGRVVSDHIQTETTHQEVLFEKMWFCLSCRTNTSTSSAESRWIRCSACSDLSELQKIIRSRCVHIKNSLQCLVFETEKSSNTKAVPGVCSVVQQEEQYKTLQ